MLSEAALPASKYAIRPLLLHDACHEAFMHCMLSQASCVFSSAALQAGACARDQPMLTSCLALASGVALRSIVEEVGLALGPPDPGLRLDPELSPASGLLLEAAVGF